MKGNYKVILIVVGLFLIFIGLLVYHFIPTKPDMYMIDGKKIMLDSGDELDIDCWNIERQNLSNYKDITIYKGIKIGSSKETVIRRYGLNSKNAKYDCEISNPESDGTTDVIHGRFTRKIFKKNYLDCYLIFAYRDGKMLSYNELDNLKKNPENLTGVVKYEIDINGFLGEVVDEGKVIKFVVTKY